MKRNEWMTKRNCWIVLLTMDYTSWALGRGEMDVGVQVVGFNEASLHQVHQGLRKIGLNPDYLSHKGELDEAFGEINQLASQAWERDPQWSLRYLETDGKRWSSAQAVVWSAKGEFHENKMDLEKSALKIKQTLEMMGIKGVQLSRPEWKKVLCSKVNDPWKKLPILEWIKEQTS